MLSHILRRIPGGRLLVVLFALTGLAILAPATSALADTGNGNPVVMTQNFHVPQSEVVVNPCNGDPIALAETSNIVEHSTFFPATGEGHMTFTEEDKLAGTDTVTNVAETGHDKFWGNGNFNAQSSNSTFTTVIHVTGSDGSSVDYHEVGHFTVNAQGVMTVAFDNPSLACTG